MAAYLFERNSYVRMLYVTLGALFERTLKDKKLANRMEPDPVGPESDHTIELEALLLSRARPSVRPPRIVGRQLTLLSWLFLVRRALVGRFSVVFVFCL
jgi:hypothetical protein